MNSPIRRFRYLLLVLLTVSGTALAQPSSQDKAQAEQLFREGRALIKAGQISEACAKFAESQSLDPQVGTLLNLGLCHEQQGKTASAWAELKEVAEADPKRAKYALERARALEARLSRVELRIAASIPDLSIKIDGRPVGPAAWSSPLPVDPGSHTVEASAPGRVPQAMQVEVPDGPVNVPVVIPELVAAEQAEAAPHATAPPTPAASPTSPATNQNLNSRSSSQPAALEQHASSTKTAGFLVGAFGIGAVAVGAIYGFRALDKRNEMEDVCPHGCTSDSSYEQAQDLSDQAKTAAIISTVGFGVGIVALGAGTLLVLSSRPAPSATSGVVIRTESTGRVHSVQLSGVW